MLELGEVQMLELGEVGEIPLGVDHTETGQELNHGKHFLFAFLVLYVEMYALELLVVDIAGDDEEKI